MSKKSNVKHIKMTIRIPEEVYNFLREEGKTNYRSINAQILYMINELITQYNDELPAPINPPRSSNSTISNYSIK